MKRIRRPLALLMMLILVITNLPTEVFAYVEREVTEQTASEDHTVTVQWIDNNDEHGMRPEAASYASGVKLYYSINGGDAVQLTEESMAQVGLSEMPLIQFTETDSSIAGWKCQLSLPSEVQIMNVQEADQEEETEELDPPVPIGEPKPVAWFIEVEEEVNGYLSELTQDDETGTLEIVYTIESEYSASIIWQDNGNIYTNRPDKTGYTVYRYLLGDNPNAAEPIENAEVVYTIEDAETWNVTIEGQPAYDRSGVPYIYFLKAESNEIPGKKTGEHYAAIYDNLDNHASVTDRMHDRGTAVLTLESNGVFTIDKIWDDDENPDRPQDCKLYLYRIAEKDGGTISQSQVDKASPVQGYDDAVVPADAEEVTVTIGEVNGEAALPMYDLEGHRYVYFALERGLVGDYVRVIDNSNSDYSDEVKGYFDNNKYVLNGGTITNTQRGTGRVDATKIFQAQAMQSMEVAVQLTLQYYDRENSAWTNVDASMLVKEEEIEESEFMSFGPDGEILMTFENFCSESLGQNEKGPTVYKYTQNGAEIRYRWVETAMRMKDQNAWTEVTHTDVSDNYASDYDTIDMGEYAPGIKGEDTTALFVPEQTANDTVVNKLVGKTEIEITKTWYDNGVNVSATDEAREWEAKFVITKDGAVLTEENDGLDGHITMTYEDLKGSRWVRVFDELERYDEQGREYEYAVREEDLPGWHVEYKIVKSIDELDGNKIPKTTYNYTNTRGPGRHLYFDVTKEWLDEGDLLTRKPVIVGLYRLSDGALVAGTETELNITNDYTSRIDISLSESSTDTVDDYIVKEITVNGIDASYTKADPKIQELQDVQDGFRYDDSRIVGKLDEGSTFSKIHYVYDIFITRDRLSDSRAFYEIANRRVGTLTLAVDKAWITGGTVPVATFEVRRSVSGGEDEVFAEFTLAPEKQGDLEASFELTDVPKYDAYGCQYLYTLIETKIGGVETTGSETQRVAAVEGDTYVSTVYQDQRIIVGNVGHHSGDYYSWTATNTRKEQYPLDAYKVWRDDGKKNITARPDVHFDVFRIAVDDETAVSLESIDDIVEYCSANTAAAEMIAADMIWNTKHNDWCWSADLGAVDRYDDDGNRYIYFLIEEFTGSPGEYSCFYSNSTAHPNTSGRVKTTVEVLSTPREELEGYDLVILSDGLHKNTSYGDYYSRAVVNGREKKRTISGRKLWLLPSGWKIPANKMPKIDIEVYRTAEKINAETSSDHDILKEAAKAGAYGLSYVNKTTLENGATQFSFTEDETGTKLDKYDQYGRTYDYYVFEATTLTEYSTKVEQYGTSGFNINNTFNFKAPNVKVDVTKLWENDRAAGEISGLAPAKFELYAQMTDADGSAIGSPFLMSSAIVDPSMTGYTFEYYTEGGREGDKLPYYGPNGRPFSYYVGETPMPNGYADPEAADGFDFEHAIELTVNASGDLYSGAVEYKNTYTGGNADKTIEKKWNESNNAGLDNSVYQPDTVTLNLYRKWPEKTIGEKTMAAGSELVTEAITLKKSENWKYTVPATLPKYAAYGQEYIYYFDEETMPGTSGEFYTGALKGNTFENTLITTKVTAKKLWELGDLEDGAIEGQILVLQKIGYLPEKMSFTLERSINGTEWTAVNTKEINVSGSHKKTVEWYGLPVKDTEHNAYSYRVVEKIGDFEFISTDGSTSGKIDEAGNYKDMEASAAVSGDEKASVITFTNQVDLKAYTVQKVWDDEDNHDNTRPKSAITIAINGQSYRIPLKAGTNTWVLDNILLPELKEGATLEDTYTVNENAITGYRLVATESGWNEENGTYTLTNTLTDKTRKTIGITASKTFVGDNVRDLKDLRPEVRFTLYFLDKSGVWTEVTEDNMAQILPEGGRIEPTQTVSVGENGGGTITYSGLLKYWTTVTTPGTAEPISYKIEESLYYNNTELEKTGYTADVSAAVVNGDSDNSKSAYTAAVTNTIEKLTIKAAKEWANDQDDRDHLREPVTVILKRNGITYDTETLDDSNQWQTTFKDLARYDVTGAEYVYTVEESEDSAKAYSHEVTGDVENGFMVTNTLITRNIDVTKKWEGDHENRDELQVPVEIILKQNGQEYDRATASLDSDWKVTFTELPMYDIEGAPFTYTVEESEESALAYEHAVTGSATTGFTVTNTMITREVEVAKIWKGDHENKDELQEPVEIILKQNGEAYQTATADTRNSWKVVFTELPKFDKTGEEFIYTVEESEDCALAYDHEVTGSVTEGFKVTNTLITVDIDVTKNWLADSDNKDELRESVEIILKQNDTEYARATADESNDWKVSFRELPKYDKSGEAFIYTVEESEDCALAYEHEVVGDVENGFEINNTLIRTQVIATKLWDNDNDDEEELRRPVTIHLYREILGEKVQYAEATASEETDWQVVFTDLPKYDLEGNEYQYFVSEDPIVGYLGSEPVEVVVESEEDTAAAYEITNTYITGGFSFKKIGLMNETCSENPAYLPDVTKLLEGVEFGLFNVDTDELIMSEMSDEYGVVTFTEVRNGHYYVQEIGAPAPYVTDDTKYMVDMLYGECTGLYTEVSEEDGTPVPMDPQVILNDQARCDITLVKVDENDHEKTIEGAKYALYREMKNDAGVKQILIKEDVTDKDGVIRFEGLITGHTYVIKELEAPDGSYISKETIRFDVVFEDGSAVIKNFKDGKGTAVYDPETGIVIWGEPRVDVSVYKVEEGSENSIGVEGAELQLLCDGKVIDEWKTEVSEDGKAIPHEINGILKAGETYTLHEKGAPEGYELAEDITIEISDEAVGAGENKVVTVFMADKKKPEETKPVNPATGDPTHLRGYVLLMLASLAAFLVLVLRRRTAKEN